MNAYNIGRVCLFVCLLHYFPKQKKKSMLHIFTKKQANGFVKKKCTLVSTLFLLSPYPLLSLYTLFILTPLLPPSN